MSVDRSLIEFRELGVEDAARLANFFQNENPAYLQHFHPFEFSKASLRQKLTQKKLDRWWGVQSSGHLVGLLLLRGFDEGYSRPSFGIVIAEKYQGHGLATRAIQFSKQWVQDQGVDSIMLKVASKNQTAELLYVKNGFIPIGTCDHTGQKIFEWRAPCHLNDLPSISNE